MKVNINIFNYKEMEKGIKEINVFLNSLEKKLEIFMKRIADIGYETAETIVDNAILDALTISPKSYNIDANVTLNKTDKGYQIVAYGSQILFIEFGTGVMATHPRGKELGMTEGSYSVTHAKRYSEKGYWYYNGEKLIGTTAFMPMYYATYEMESRIVEIAKEVFSS